MGQIFSPQPAAKNTGSDALAFDFARQLFDRLLGTGPVRVHFREPAQDLQGLALLTDVAQDLGEAVESLEMMGIEGERTSQIPESQPHVVELEMHEGAPVPAFREVRSLLDHTVEK